MTKSPTPTKQRKERVTKIKFQLLNPYDFYIEPKVREIKPLKAYCDECCKTVEIDPVEFCKDLNGKSFADIVCKKGRHIIATIGE